MKSLHWRLKNVGCEDTANGRKKNFYYFGLTLQVAYL